MMKFSSTMTIQYDTIFSPFTAAQYLEALTGFFGQRI